MMCIFLLMNLIKMTYLTIYQIEYLVNLDKKNDRLGQNGQSFLVIGIFNQVGQNTMASLVKMDNGVLVKYENLCYLINKNNYKLN